MSLYRQKQEKAPLRLASFKIDYLLDAATPAGTVTFATFDRRLLFEALRTKAVVTVDPIDNGGVDRGTVTLTPGRGDYDQSVHDISIAGIAINPTPANTRLREIFIDGIGMGVGKEQAEVASSFVFADNLIVGAFGTIQIVSTLTNPTQPKLIPVNFSIGFEVEKTALVAAQTVTLFVALWIYARGDLR